MKNFLRHFPIEIFMLVLLLYGAFIRNNHVFLFRNRISSQVFWLDYTVDRDSFWNMYNKYSYEEMLFSSKPLKASKWYTEEEIKRFHLENVDGRPYLLKKNPLYDK